MAMKIDTSEWHTVEASAKPLAIEARGLVKRFDGFAAVDGIERRAVVRCGAADARAVEGRRLPADHRRHLLRRRRAASRLA